MSRHEPRYPVYVLSKGRYETCYTAQSLIEDGVDFTLVVEASEEEAYRSRFECEVCTVVVLPPEATGRGAIPVRNWIWEQTIQQGAERHWQLDDNLRGAYRWYKGKRIPCHFGVALRVCEDFSDRYKNVAVSGLNYEMFGVPTGTGVPPFYLNTRVYSCVLIRNDLTVRWRGRYNADTDLCLQVLSTGECTVLLNAFLVDKVRTMVLKGGNTDELYRGDGRLRMARSLERKWPGVVEVKRRFGRPQHVVKDGWKKFDTPLELKEGIDLEALPRVDEYGMELKAKKSIKSESLRRWYDREKESGKA